MPADQEPTRTELEQQEGRRQLERWAERANIEKRTQYRRSARRMDLGTLHRANLSTDQDVKLPEVIQATIARGNTAFRQQSRLKPTCRKRRKPKIITAVTDQTLQDRRDSYLTAREQPAKGRRQPPMIARLRVVMVVVDRLMAEGVPFCVGPNSRMNKEVCKWLNEKAGRSPDPRASRRKLIGGTAVRKLLRQVKAEGGPTPQRVIQRRRTTQEEAGERLRALQASRDKSPD